MVEVINNITSTLKEDLQKSIKRGDKISIASACFSIYAFQELKEQLKSIDSLRFIFTSPTFVKEHAPRERKQFYIPSIQRERSIYGTEFEVRLRNELTQKAIAKECADWIIKKVEFRSNVTDEHLNTFMNVESSDSGVSYTPLQGFTTIDLGCERGNNMSNNVVKIDYSETKEFVKLFESVWSDKNKMKDVKNQVLEAITAAYVENPPNFIYFFTLYNIFSEFLDDISADYLPNEGVGFRESKIWNMLYPFQKDAAYSIINKLDMYNGCILADSVGLGKTFTALAIIKYYECRNKNVLVLCPKKLHDNWKTYRGNYINNPLAEDRLRYDVYFHTDLSRIYTNSDLRLINWSNYDLVVIDESHNFRNGGDINDPERDNRYTRLLNEIVRKGVQTKVLMLSATPVNNRFYDLRNQLEIAYEGNPLLINNNLKISRPLDDVFKNAQKAFNKWSKLPIEERNTDALLDMLDFDFFEVLDSVTIARSRRHIEKNYNMEGIGKFPKRLPPISKRPNITDMPGVAKYSEVNDLLNKLNLAIYVPTQFLYASRVSKYVDEGSINVRGREMGIRRLMSIALLKRLESSVHSFRITLDKVKGKVESAIDLIDHYDKKTKVVITDYANLEYDEDAEPDELFALGKKFEIDLQDIDLLKWKNYLTEDNEILQKLHDIVVKITPEYDKKLTTLRELVIEKINHPINEGNRKILIFSAFTDTADYLYDNLKDTITGMGLQIGEVTGDNVRSSIPKLKDDFNNVLTCFSPVSKNADLLLKDIPERIDILIGTDCISEGQNLQDCDYCVNYDIHWNPVRIIQRFGRVDRIGSTNDVIQLVNFWPDVDLDEYIQLKGRVETRMRVSVLTSTGDDDPINEDEHGDLEYRSQQLKRLQQEVVDIEEMQSGISILDLGLNEFRLDLLDYVREHGGLDSSPFGLHAVVPSSLDMPQGTIFVLKNINENVNIDHQNRLHPFYMVYVRKDGEIQCDHLSPKNILDLMRYTCRDRMEPIKPLCDAFNIETNNGKNMKEVSELLQTAIESIISVKSQSDIESFLSGGEVSFANTSRIRGLDDFELICFLVVR